MKTISIETPELEKSKFLAEAKANKRIKIITDSYKIIFCNDFIKLGSNIYAACKWKRFSLPELREMAELEMLFWCKWGSFFNELSKLYSEVA